MSVVAEARMYSVAVEMADGTSTVVRVQGQSTGEAFQQVKNMPGVRRVGRVVEGTNLSSGQSSGSRSDTARNEPRREARSVVDRQDRQQPPANDPAATLGNKISGPRVVAPFRRTGVEQPFKNLKAPDRSEEELAAMAARAAAIEAAKAERRARAKATESLRIALGTPAPVEEIVEEPIRAAEPVPAVVTAVAPQDVSPVADESAAMAAQAPADVVNAPAEEAAVAVADAEPVETVYRVYKSRRRDGLPYLVQAGHWTNQGNKRVFVATGEEGYADRAGAEARLAEFLPPAE